DEVPLAACSTKPINLEECILCQKKKKSEYLSSGEIGRGVIVSLAKQTESNDTRAARVLQLTVQEQGIIKYHTSSCYRTFQRDMAKTDSTQPLEPGPSQQSSTPIDDTSERRSTRIKSSPSVTKNVCIICGADIKTVNQKKIHKTYRICEKPIAQKMLNAANLFKDRVYNETAAMCDVNDVFAADIRYHKHCCKEYFNKYHAKIEEILRNMEMEDSLIAEHGSLKARFLAFGLDFSRSAHSLTSIRDRLNKGSAEIVSNRAVKQLIIQLYGSGVPFDQALEQCYNRPAKVSGGIIGVTRKKEAVALWGIIKHKKDQYVELLEMKGDVGGELSLHHAFNPSTATKIVMMVQDIEEYLQKVCSPLQDQVALKNVLTGEIVTNVNVDKLLCCLTEGSAACAKFIDDRLRNRSISIHSTISRIKFRSPKTILKLTSKADIKDETIKALKFIEYGCHRGFTLEELLQHEITNSAFFLVDKDGYLRKSAKSQLGAELLKLCPLIDKKGPQTSPKTHAAIIDFMALVRKVPLKKLHPPVKTFHDFAIALTSMVTKAGNNCDEIHIVFDTYREDSIKNGERERRGKSKDMVVLDVILPNQNVPVVLENFWSSSISKTAFQAFYVQWLTTNYQGTKPLYLGVKRSILPLHDICISLGDELTKCLPALHALTGCDTTSKISTKLAALNAVREPENSCLILNFDCPQLTESAIQMAETFLVKCLKPSTDLETFDDLRIAAFDSNALNMDFERTTCTSTNARKHILRGYYQQQLWVQAPFRDATLIMNAESYGFVRRGSLLVPEIVISKPEGLPDPCSCGKCARKNGCPCRVAGIRCCKYCKCKGGDCCKNPITE
ncbi:hypothetical protein F7725_017651, partial [Dissostichus mawsoni]